MTEHPYGKTLLAAGFTLVELLVAVAIVGILAGIAIPFYGDFVTEGRRTDGHKLLFDLAEREEQHFFDYKRYSVSTIRLGYVGDATSDHGDYIIDADDNGIKAKILDDNRSEAVCPAGVPCFLLSAKPVDAQSSDTDCGNLRLDSRGRKGATGCDGKSGAAKERCLDECW